ncbi:MAG TPA: hypothetical protein VGF50_03215 [Caulobacteraceae bacterium]
MSTAAISAPDGPMQGGRAWWPGELFLSEAPGFPHAVDITGPPRCLSFGPYVRLGSGAWRAEVELELCADAARYDYRVEFGTNGDFSETIARAGGAGRHVATLRHQLSEPAPAEVRVSLARAAFHGRFALIGVRVAAEP